MSLLADVVGQLGRSSTACAMVGATAMAAHGVARSTMDTDLLVVDASAMKQHGVPPPPLIDYFFFASAS